MDRAPPSGEVIVTPAPVWRIEPMVIGWPWSAAMEFPRPRLLAIWMARDRNFAPPVTRAGNVSSWAISSLPLAERNAGLVGTAGAIERLAELGSKLAPSTLARLPLNGPADAVAVATPGVTPVADWPW